jgi:hypothetical protein
VSRRSCSRVANKPGVMAVLCAVIAAKLIGDAIAGFTS